MPRIIALSEQIAELAEKANTAPRYVDRELIDYWRTIQGTPVGFHGKVPGEGVPIAGPPVLTGGSGSSNPLLDPLLKKYPAGTFTGDAIRKPNFPLSLCVFFDKVLGDNGAIMKRMGELGKFYNKTGNANHRGAKALENVFKNSPEKKAAYNMLLENFDTLSGSMSTICSIMNSLGISGTLKPSDGAAGKTPEQIDLFLKNRGTSRQAVEEMLRDVYLMNQYILRKNNKSGVEVVTRGFGGSIPGLSGEQSKQFIRDAKIAGVPIRIAGVRSCAPTASGDRSGFGYFGFQSVPLPIEATLSSYEGARIQKDKFPSERETMALGLADLAIDPKYLTTDTTVTGSAEKENNALSGSQKPSASALQLDSSKETVASMLGSEIGKVVSDADLLDKVYGTFQIVSANMKEYGDPEAANVKYMLANTAAYIAKLNAAKGDPAKHVGGLTGFGDVASLAVPLALLHDSLKKKGASGAEVKAASEYLLSGDYRKKPPVASIPVLNTLHDMTWLFPDGTTSLSNNAYAALAVADYYNNGGLPSSVKPEAINELIEKRVSLYQANPHLRGVRLKNVNSSSTGEWKPTLAYFVGESEPRKFNPNSDSDIASMVDLSLGSLANTGEHFFMDDYDITTALALGEKLGVSKDVALKQYANAIRLLLTVDTIGSFKQGSSNATPVARAVYDAVINNPELEKERQLLLKKRAANIMKKQANQ